MLLLLAACAPPAEVASDPLAGCAVAEVRRDADGGKLLDGTRSWDDLGRPLEADTSTWRDGVEHRFEERYTWGHDELEGASYRTSSDGVEGPWVDERYLWRPDGLLLRLDREYEDHDAAVHATEAWTWDADGHLREWVHDRDGDGVVDEWREEDWEREGFGWTVTEERVWVGSEPLWSAYREHDEAGHELFSTEDWDRDEISEIVRSSTWDGEHLVHQDVGGVAVVDWSCDWTWDGDDLVMEVCEELDTTWTTTWSWLGPKRPVSAEVLREEGGVEELAETWTYDWTCP